MKPDIKAASREHRTYRSSKVADADKHCPAAYVHAEIGTPREKTGAMMIGVCAHAFNEHVFREAGAADLLADGVQVALIGDGRRFEGGPPEHATPDQAQKGRDLALSYMDREKTPEPGEADVLTELVVDLDRDWKKTGGPARWRQALDYVATYDDEDAVGDPVRVVHVIDWKGWNYKGWHDTTQGRAAAVSADAIVKVDIIRLTCASYQLGSWETEEIDLRYDEDRDRLADYRRGLERTMEGLDRLPLDVERVANPGTGCVGCPYFQRCAPAQKFVRFMGESFAPVESVAEAVRTLPIAQQHVKECRALLRSWCNAHGDATAPAGTYRLIPSSRRKVAANAFSIIAREWAEGVAALGVGTAESIQLAAAIETMLKAGKPGVGVVDNLVWKIARTCAFDREQREALEARCVHPAASGQLELVASNETGEAPGPTPPEQDTLLGDLQASLDAIKGENSAT